MIKSLSNAKYNVKINLEFRPGVGTHLKVAGQFYGKKMFAGRNFYKINALSST